MNTNLSKLTLISYTIPILIALVIILDFSLPGKVYTEDVVKIERELQRYYNAGGNYHYSYKVVTSKHKFAAEEKFAKEAKNKAITYSVSLIFNKVNRHSIVESSNSSIHSFRIASGLGFPLIVIFTLIICYRYKKKWNTLQFVLQVILLADLFILMS